MFELGWFLAGLLTGAVGSWALVTVVRRRRARHDGRTGAVRGMEQPSGDDEADAPDFRRFVEHIHERYFFYRHDPAGHFTFLSPSIERVLGYSGAEYRAHYAAMFTDNPINDVADRKTRLAIEGKQQPTYEIEVEARDGSLRHLEVTEYPVFDEEGRVVAVEGIAHDVTGRIRLQERLRELAIRDELTGLFNRRHLLERLEEAVAMARRHGHPLALAFVDLDRFKHVNDTHGHAAGDRVLERAAQVLRREMRAGDVVARAEGITGRLGGDEFGVVLPFNDAARARTAFQRVLAALAEEPVEVSEGRSVHVSASVGIATLQADLGIDDLERRADRALYRAKDLGRGRICLWREVATTRAEEPRLRPPRWSGR